MSKSQRTKGAVFEREVCDLFTAYLRRKVTRNIGQARDGGNDIDVGRFVVECKRRASLKGLRDWMAQAQVAANARYLKERGDTGWQATGVPIQHADHIPIVVMREDGGADPMVLMQWADFLYLNGQQIDGDVT